MEELRSTEVLDREILEDARKKAFKILKAADDTVQTQSQRWQKKTDRSLKEIRKTYAQRAEKIKEEILARLPLDKRRLRSETAENFLKSALDAFLQGRSREELLAVLEREFTERLAASALQDDKEKNEKNIIRYSAMDREEAENLLRKLFSKISKNSKDENKNALPFKGEWELQKDDALSGSPAFVLNIREAKISASVEDAAGELLKEKRAELASARLGEGVLKD
jgi:hypothetical protein